MCEVIHIKNAPNNWKDLSNYVYIGRSKKSIGVYGNPFTMKEESSRNRVIKQYESYFEEKISTDSNFRVKIQKLALITDLKLVCFCKPKPCHGDIMKEYLDNFSKDQLMLFDV